VGVLTANGLTPTRRTSCADLPLSGRGNAALWLHPNPSPVSIRRAKPPRRACRARTCQSLPSGLTRGSRRPMRGDGAPKSANLWFRSVDGHGGRLPARHMRSSRPEAGSACYLRRFIEHRAPLSNGLTALHRREASEAQGQVVSQLLAGAHSGPGGSPSAARVFMLRA
jgi:hypothetical protein